MPTTSGGPRAIGTLELDIKQFQEAIDVAKKLLIGLGAAFAAIKTVDFWKDNIAGAIEFGNQAYFAAQKLNGYDPGKLFIVQKALQAGGLAAEEARQKISDFALSNRPLEQLFKGGSAGFADALTRAAKEYGTQASVLSQSAEKFAYVQQQLTNLGTKIQGFFLGLADQISGPLSALFAQIDKIDLVGMGEKFGKYITEAINAIRGLISQGNLFSTLSLALKVGFETAVNYLTGGLNTALGVLLEPGLWSGVAKIALGALGIIGTFLTNMILGIGKILVATFEAAAAKLENKNAGAMALLKHPVETAALYATAKRTGNKLPVELLRGLAGYDTGAGSSEDVSKNLADNEKSPLIAAEDKGSLDLIAKLVTTAKSGVDDLKNIQVAFTPGKTYDTSEDSKNLFDLLTKAAQQGAKDQGPSGKINPLFSETADPYHVIADSLAKVGGGGRYVRTGLSIAEKAQIDSLLVQRQIQTNTAIIANAAKKGTPTSSTKGG
jgi:hypothetical protein